MTPAELIRKVQDAVLANPNKGFHLIPEYLDNLPELDRLWRESIGRGRFGIEQQDPEGKELPPGCRSCRIERIRKLLRHYSK